MSPRNFLITAEIFRKREGNGSWKENGGRAKDSRFFKLKTKEIKVQTNIAERADRIEQEKSRVRGLENN